MTIRFQCDNPQCATTIRAPDSMAFKKVRCPACGKELTIPGSGVVVELEPPMPPATPVSQGPATSQTSPASQAPPASSLPGGSSEPAAEIDELPALPSLATQYICAIRYGWSNFKSIVILVLYLIGIAIGISAVGGPLAMLPGVGLPLAMLVGLIIQLAIGGLFLRYYMDVVTSSMEGLDTAPSLPDFILKQNIAMGVRALGIVAVYIGPLVTIPLLPLGLLALSYTDDNRAFDVRWALRAARKRPWQIAGLWAALLVWGGMAAGVDYAVRAGLAAIFKPSGPLMVDQVLLTLVCYALGIFLIGAATSVFLCVIFRCIGMMGRYNEDLLELLPETIEPRHLAMYIGAGTVVSVIVFGWVVPWLIG